MIEDYGVAELEERKRDVYRNYGFWGGPSLAWACEQAAGVTGLSGTPDVVHRLSQAYSDAAKPLYDALEALGDISRLNVSGVWTGTAHSAAVDAMTAMYQDLTKAHQKYQEIADRLHVYADRLAPALVDDETGMQYLRVAGRQADQFTAGSFPDPSGYDGDAMRRAHHLAMTGVDLRLAAHVEVRDAGQDFAVAMHDVASQARAFRLDGCLDPVSRVVITGAGEGAILTPAMEQRASAALSAMTVDDRERAFAMLARAKSPEQRAYLLRALAAGYPLDEVIRFNDTIDAHGEDLLWLDQHLSPLSLDDALAQGVSITAFDGAQWTQGDHPTCVASSTVTARAEVDPLYALQLTTGGHPDDPQFDNPEAFARRLQDEQYRVYDGDRHWYENWWDDGMTNEQSDRVADKEIAVHTGVEYDNVDLNDVQSRQDALRSAERAVDDGYPVPLTTNEGDRGHQMMIIGHSADRVQIYNPWGYTFWLSESDFVSGHVDAVDPDIPSMPTALRLPQGAR